MALSDDLRDYIAANGRDTPPTDTTATVVIVGETHAFLKRTTATIRTTATARVVRGLLADKRFRYFANESFMNAGPVRHAVHDYWVKGVLPPEFTSGKPADEALSPQEVGRRVLTRRFQPVLDTLKANPRYVLSIGSTLDGAGRDRRLAQHLVEEIQDRKLGKDTPGIVLLGAAHAAAVPFYLGRPTTRMILEDQGFRCVSVLVMTDFYDEDRDLHDDAVAPMQSGDPITTNLGSLTLKSPVTFGTRLSGGRLTHSPFESVINPFSDGGNSIAEQYEFIVLHKVA